MRILGLSGSLRQASRHTALLRLAAEMMPDGVSLVLHDLRGLPFYDHDLETAGGDALNGVAALNAAIAAADAVLIACPEYNHSVTAVLKNAIDWASRPAMRSPFAGKRVGVIGAAPGIVGTARVQGHLKMVLLSMLAQPFPWPELLVGQSKNRFTDGALTDETTREFLGKFIDGFVDYVQS